MEVVALADRAKAIELAITVAPSLAAVTVSPSLASRRPNAVD
jgi:hypothetical protein